MSRFCIWEVAWLIFQLTIGIIGKLSAKDTERTQKMRSSTSITVEGIPTLLGFGEKGQRKMATKVPDRLLAGLAKQNLSSQEWRVMMYVIHRLYKGNVRLVWMGNQAASDFTGMSRANIYRVVSKLQKRGILYLVGTELGRKLHAIQTRCHLWQGSTIGEPGPLELSLEWKFSDWLQRWPERDRRQKDLARHWFRRRVSEGFTAAQIQVATTRFFQDKLIQAGKKGVSVDRVMKFRAWVFLRMKMKEYLREQIDNEKQNNEERSV